MCEKVFLLCKITLSISKLWRKCCRLSTVNPRILTFESRHTVDSSITIVSVYLLPYIRVFTLVVTYIWRYNPTIPLVDMQKNPFEWILNIWCFNFFLICFYWAKLIKNMNIWNTFSFFLRSTILSVLWWVRNGRWICCLVNMLIFIYHLYF